MEDQAQEVLGLGGAGGQVGGLPAQGPLPHPEQRGAVRLAGEGAAARQAVNDTSGPPVSTPTNPVLPLRGRGTIRPRHGSRRTYQRKAITPRDLAGGTRQRLAQDEDKAEDMESTCGSGGRAGWLVTGRLPVRSPGPECRSVPEQDTSP